METLRRFKTILLPLCAVCLALAVWMLVHSLTGVRMVGCGPGGGCDSVMGSPWGYLLGGVPVSLPAVVTYVLLLVCLLFLGSDRSLDRLLWFLMPLLGGCIVGVALWFCFVQLFILRAFCPYCTAVHLLGCGVALWICLEARRQGKNPWGPLCTGLAVAVLFALVQARTLPPAAYDKGETGAELPLFRGDETPVLGPADAPEELTLLFDFQCIHCRRLHRVLPELIGKSGDSLRIRLCPVPLSSSCNPYIPATGSDRFAGSCALTRLALAVWYAAPEKYAACWDALLGGGDEHLRVDPAEAERLVRDLLGDSFEEACQDPRIDAYLKQVYELFGRTSTLEKGGVPRLILGRKWLVPEVDDAYALLSLIRNELQ